MADSAVLSTDPLLERLVKERNQKLNLINTVKSAAFESSRDLNDDDKQAIEMAKERVAAIDAQISLVGDNLEMDADTRERLSRLAPQSQLMGVPKYRNAGDLLWDCLHANYGSAHDRDDQDATMRWRTVMQRAAQHIGTDAAQTTPVAGGFGGLYVVPVVGPVIDLFPSARPFLSAIGTRPAPNSLNFTRPRIVDPDFTTGAAVQALQKAELASKKFDVKTDTLELETVGGYLNVSVQLLSLQPGSLDIIVTQLQRRVAYQSEAAAIAHAGQTTAEVPLANTADSKAVIKAVFDAAALVYQNTLALPTFIAMGPSGWARLGSLCDSAGRPLFPFIGATNAFGTATADSFNMTGPAGLTSVVTPAITTPDLFVGNGVGMEAYEFAFPVLEAVEPSVMGRQVAVASAMCFFSPVTKEAVTTPAPLPEERNGLVKIEWAP